MGAISRCPKSAGHARARRMDRNRVLLLLNAARQTRRKLVKTVRTIEMKLKRNSFDTVLKLFQSINVGIRCLSAKPEAGRGGAMTYA